MYKTELIQTTVTIDTLLEYYDSEKVETYCKNCNNYNKIWSCPPHDFNTLAYFDQFKDAELYALKIHLPEGLSKDETMEIFQTERRKFSDTLMSKEADSEALIAGNCYQCKTCNRENGAPCVLKEKRRYSLEALGLIVSEVTEHLLGVKLMWTKEGEAGYMVTVGALLK